MAWLRRGTTRLILAAFILLGLIFGTSLGYLALGALRAAKSQGVRRNRSVAINVPNLSPGDGWEYAFYAAREHSSKTSQGPSDARKWGAFKSSIFYRLI